MVEMSIEIKEAVDRELSWYQAYKNLAEQKLEEINKQIILLKRQQWWLSNPEIAVIQYVAEYETNYAHSEWETYPIISWRSIIDTNGEETWDVGTIEYAPLESEITDEKTLITVRNPFLCT